MIKTCIFMVWNSTSLYERTSSTADEQFLLKHPVRELQTELLEFFSNGSPLTRRSKVSVKCYAQANNWANYQCPGHLPTPQKTNNKVVALYQRNSSNNKV